jgi:D-alanine-D-alanine ligase
MTRVAVLAGGLSDEREVSLRSGAAVAEALTAAGYAVTILDTIDNLAALRRSPVKFDVVFPALHGKGGEDGTVQQQLDDLMVPYVGTGAAASALCFDKWRYKQFLADRNYPVTTGELVEAKSFAATSLQEQPFVLKPYDGGSSIDTFIVRNPADAPLEKIHEAFERHNQLLIEPLVEGTEITVGVLGDEALTVIEIIPPTGGEFDYTNKYNGRTAELCPPEHVSEDAQARAQQLAAELHKVLGCKGFSRTDMIVGPDDSLTILETNTIPGMTDQSLFPKAAAAKGIDMPMLVDRLVKDALDSTDSGIADA